MAASVSAIPTIITMLFLTLLVCRQSPAATRYVSPAGGNTAPYTDWASAAHTIQDAVDVAVSNDLVLVGDGVYDAGGALSRFGYSNRVMVSKSIALHSVNGPATTIILGKGPVGIGSVRCVYVTNGGFITGFTLKNGYADSLGGGAFLDNGGVLSNCVITGGERYGAVLYWNGLLTDCIVISNNYGGVYISRDGRLEGCTISDNVSTNRYGKGGGVYISMDGVVDRCLISGNRLTGDRSEGGGVYFGQEPSQLAVVRFSTIVGNSAGLEGGGVRITGNEYDWAMLDNCTICSNTAGDAGGGVSFWYGGRVNDCRVFANNAGWGGGGFYFHADGLHPIQRGEARNCTIAGNSAGMHGGGTGTDGPSVVYNSIVCFNTAPGSSNYDSYTTFSYCCSDPLPVGTGNIRGDPLFQDVHSADYHLLKMSPCINTGNNAATNGLLDLDGLPRIRGGTVNMGCYEQNRDPGIPPPALNTLLALSGNVTKVVDLPTTGIYIMGTKSANAWVVVPNEFSGWITNRIVQTLSGLEWAHMVYVPIVSSNTLFYRQSGADFSAVSTGFVSRTIVLVPETGSVFWAFGLGWPVLRHYRKKRSFRH